MEETETFLAIARSGSLAQAARIVHISQSTVSYRLERLEKRLGRRLVHRARGAKSIELTAAGQRYRELAEQWELLVSKAARIREVPHASLAMGGTDAISIYLFDTLVGELSARLPQVRLTLETGRSGALCDRVVAGHLDVAFVFYKPVHTDLRVRTLAHYPMVAAVNDPEERAAAEHDAEPLPLTALSGLNEVYLPWGPDYDLWRERNLLREPAHSVTMVHALPPVLHIPGSWTVVPAFMADDLYARTGCRIVPLRDGPPDRTVYWAERKRRRAGNASALQELLAISFPGLRS
ncbi:LysR family transcriptional regulator [Streptomyces sp. NEAU-YJ-81]|uniref:LysR family transcriptional regulator n=1 Tax=Streptomyces sp. NEAU-YJ-81 TaxID=2820288 RepID=UPI001ABC2619|nr:LysR family transcriptional regulator [Streptomyces sp. NEAU-YJ-81]MBO3682115.1 LysR family transcriptional regulator [Streptomyces sp. NEAU-YJ-81]